MTDNKGKTILIIPNEDGFGPSSLAYHIVQSLLQKRPLWRILLWNKSRFSYNQRLYQKYIRDGRVTVKPIWNIIQLQKSMGRVSMRETLKLMSNYNLLSETYANQRISDKIDVIVDIGVPPATRLARHNELPCISVFDHSWGKTFEMLSDYVEEEPEGPLSLKECEDWRHLIKAVQRDERDTQKILLMPDFITPKLYLDYWYQRINVEVTRLPGVLGGTVASKQEAMGTLQIREGMRTILIQGGDTPVWDDMLRHLFPVLVREAKSKLQERNTQVIVYLPERLLKDVSLKDALNYSGPNVYFLNELRNATLQRILPCIDLMITRPGGGTVNDCVACRVPFVCLEEKSQPQCQSILYACITNGLTRIMNAEAFLNDPVSVLLKESDSAYDNKRIVEQMNKVPIHGEAMIVQEIVELTEGRT